MTQAGTPSSERARRREDQRRRRLRARRLGVGALVAGVAAAVAIVVLAGGSDPEPPTTSAQINTSQDSPAPEPAEEPAPAAEPCAAPPTDEPAPPERDRRAVPVLMYHEIGTPPADAALPELFVNPSDFKAQMKWLDREGYEAVTLDAVDAGWSAQGAPLPDKPVVISFDDGLLGQYVNALETLDKRGWPGVLNLKIESLTQKELTRKMVCEMIESGWEVSSHTVTHPDLTTLDGEALMTELTESRRELQRRFDVPVNHFAYPGGVYNDQTIEAVRAAGYKGALSTELGLASPDRRFDQPRVRVNGSDGLNGLIATMESVGG